MDMIRGITHEGIVYVNLTPHELNVIMDDGEIVNIPPSGIKATCDTSTTPVRRIGGATGYRRSYGAVHGIPDPQDGMIYVTSGPAAEAAHRFDVVSPGDQVQLDDGKRACKGFAVWDED